MRRIATWEGVSVLKRAIYAVLLVVIVGGAYVAGDWHGKKSGSGGPAGARKILYYVDPMHPAYKSDKPGIAPDCGMQLEPVFEDGGAPAAGPGVAHPGAVNVAQEQRQMLGVRVAKAEKSSGAVTLRLFGKVAADETRIYRVTAAIDGWVRKSYPVSAGSLVRKDQLLATYYAPEFLGPQQAYIYAMGAMDRFQATGKETQGQIDQTNLNIKQYRDSLANMGMADRQIDDIARDRRFTEDIWVISPATGFLLARNITEGERFDKGKELFRVADLGNV
jgi:Cu(I)/Ag(I) efflux system membrane fusion protein